MFFFYRLYLLNKTSPDWDVRRAAGVRLFWPSAMCRCCTHSHLELSLNWHLFFLTSGHVTHTKSYNNHSSVHMFFFALQCAGREALSFFLNTFSFFTILWSTWQTIWGSVNSRTHNPISQYTIPPLLFACQAGSSRSTWGYSRLCVDWELPERPEGFMQPAVLNAEERFFFNYLLEKFWQ